MCGWERDQVGYSTKRFVCGTLALAVDTPGVHGKVSLFPFGPGFHRCIVSFPFPGFLLVVAQLESRGSSLHG
jgi:hypothetical protein